MLALRKQYGPILTQGKFILIPAQDGDSNGQVIAFARQAAGKTLLILANKDLNACQEATLKIPGLSDRQPLRNLAPAYGGQSWFHPLQDKIDVRLAPGKFYLFEIDTPDLAQRLPAY